MARIILSGAGTCAIIPATPEDFPSRTTLWLIAFTADKTSPTRELFCPQCGKSKAGTTSSGGGTAVVAVHKTETEKTFLSTPGATVTNTRIIVPGKTYAMAGITSVRSTVVGANRSWAILTAVIGLILLFAQQPGWGIFLCVGGIIWAFALKDSMAVAINSASGEIQAVVSKDAKYIFSIVQAVNEAIVYRN